MSPGSIPDMTHRWWRRSAYRNPPAARDAVHRALSGRCCLSLPGGANKQQRRRMFVALRAEVTGQAGIMLRQRIQRQHIGQPGMGHAHCAIRPERGLQRHAGAGLVALDADAIEQVDRRTIAGMAHAVAAVMARTRRTQAW